MAAPAANGLAIAGLEEGDFYLVRLGSPDLPCGTSGRARTCRVTAHGQL